MKILIMGAGVIGVSTAYELVKAGCDVSVVDHQPAAGLETSFAMLARFRPAMPRPGPGPGFPSRLFSGCWTSMGRWCCIRGSIP